MDEKTNRETPKSKFYIVQNIKLISSINAHECILAIAEKSFCILNKISILHVPHGCVHTSYVYLCVENLVGYEELKKKKTSY